MRSAMGPASASRRQASSEPSARTSSSSPVRMSLSTAFRTASPVTFVGRSTPRSSRREAVDRMTSWVSVSLAIGILHCVGAASLPPPPQPHLGHVAGGAGSRGRVAPGTVTLPLCLRPNASPFWIMLLLVWSRLDNWMIPFWQVGRLVGRAAAAFALAATIAADVPAFAQSAARGHVRCPNGGVDQGKFYCNVKPVATGPASAAP
jgi:hypothetical protein